MNGSFITVSYFEIKNGDFTGVVVKIYDERQEHVATLSNFDIGLYKGRIIEKQTDSFEIDVQVGYLLFSSNPGFEVTYKALKFKKYLNKPVN
jgi:hypothetical protein